MNCCGPVELDRRPVTPDEMRTIEPAVQGKYYGGFFTESDATGDIHKFTRGLAAACERRGARLLCEAEVTGLRGEEKRGFHLLAQGERCSGDARRRRGSHLRRHR